MVSFDELWKNHPTNTGDQAPCKTGGVSNFANQCAIRMGVCLQGAGVTPAQMGSAKTCNWAKNTAHSLSNMHYIRAREVALSLRGGSIPGVGTTDIVQNPGNFANELNGRTGIIFFNGYWWRTEDTVRPTGDHIDLWNGWRTTAKMLLPWFGWLGGYEKSNEIWFWEVK